MLSLEDIFTADLEKLQYYAALLDLDASDGLEELQALLYSKLTSYDLQEMLHFQKALELSIAFNESFEFISTLIECNEGSVTTGLVADLLESSSLQVKPEVFLVQLSSSLEARVIDNQIPVQVSGSSTMIILVDGTEDEHQEAEKGKGGYRISIGDKSSNKSSVCALCCSTLPFGEHTYIIEKVSWGCRGRPAQGV